MIREGSGEPLVLLHGVTGAAGMWAEVMPLLSPHFDTIALTALGHSGGREPAERPVRMKHVVDDCERSLDELGIEKAHLAGNSMGGWMALELARRGRALTVCALSPSGTWPPGQAAHTKTRQRLRQSQKDARRTRPILPLLMRFSRMRSFGVRLNAVHGERLSARFIVDRADDHIACTILDDILETPESLEPLDPLPCPVTIAWSSEDRVLPLKRNGEHARKIVPQARFVVLDGIGHVPFFDDPELTARTIIESARA